MAKFGFLKTAAQKVEQVAEKVTSSHGMPSFGGNASHIPHYNTPHSSAAGQYGYRKPSMMERAMNFADQASYMTDSFGGIGGIMNGATDIAAYGDMSMDAWSAFSDVMKEGFNAKTIGELGGVVAEGIIYNQLKDMLPAPVAMMLANCAEKFIEDFAKEHGMGGGAAEVASTAHPDAKKTIESAHPDATSGDSQKKTTEALAAHAIAADPEQQGTSQAANGKTWKSDVADWADGIGTVVGQIPVVGDIGGAVIGAAGAGMRYADGDSKGAMTSLAGAGANLMPGPTGLLVNGAIAATEIASNAKASGGVMPSDPKAEVMNALKTGGFDMSSLISCGSNMDGGNLMNLAGCSAPSIARKNHSMALN